MVERKQSLVTSGSFKSSQAANCNFVRHLMLDKTLSTYYNILKMNNRSFLISRYILGNTILETNYNLPTVY